MSNGLLSALDRLGDLVKAKPEVSSIPPTAPLYGGVCRVRQYSDMMQCECGIQYDTNDGDPPCCPATGEPAPENGAARRA